MKGEHWAHGLDEAGSGDGLWNFQLEEDHMIRSGDGIGNFGLEEGNMV